MLFKALCFISIFTGVWCNISYFFYLFYPFSAPNPPFAIFRTTATHFSLLRSFPGTRKWQPVHCYRAGNWFLSIWSTSTVKLPSFWNQFPLPPGCLRVSRQLDSSRELTKHTAIPKKILQIMPTMTTMGAGMTCRCCRFSFSLAFGTNHHRPCIVRAWLWWTISYESWSRAILIAPPIA